jgi:hypothetical protein
MTSRMARPRTAPRSAGNKDLVSRLTDAGEEALQRIAELPGGQRAVSAFNDLRSSVDELGKKVRGIDRLEERVAALEKEVAALKRSKATTRRTSTARRKTPPPSTA